jgi:type IV secretory pathway VirJ component
MRAPPAIAVILALGAPALPAGAAERFRFRDLGEVTVQAPDGAPEHMVILVSPAGQADAPARQLTQALVARQALVAVVSSTRAVERLARSRTRCAYPAGDVEALSNYVQMTHTVAEHLSPLLVGLQGGAAFLFAVVAQAPPHLYGRLVTVAFTSELTAHRPFCRGGGLTAHLLGGTRLVLSPSHAIEIPWRAVQGTADAALPPEGLRPFVAAAQDARVIAIPGLGHGLEGSPWVATAADETLAAPEKAAAPVPEAVSDLPVVEVPATGPARHELALVISGDGGWADIDRQLAHELSSQGLATVGLSSLRYFWHGRDAEGTARDVARILRYYGEAWHADGSVLIGYSRGADVLPATFNRLPPDLQERTRLIALLGPSRTVTWEFHLSDWIGGAAGPAQPTAPEIDRITHTPVACFYGADEEDTACPTAKRPNVTRIEMRGGHHFDGDYAALARRILAELDRAAPAASAESGAPARQR